MQVDSITVDLDEKYSKLKDPEFRKELMQRVIHILNILTQKEIICRAVVIRRSSGGHIHLMFLHEPVNVSDSIINSEYIFMHFLARAVAGDDPERIKSDMIRMYYNNYHPLFWNRLMDEKVYKNKKHKAGPWKDFFRELDKYERKSTVPE